MQFNTEEGKKRLLEDLVNQELFYLEAKDENLHNDENFKAEMKRIEENMLKQYSINKVLASVKLTDEEIANFYEAN
ncbi:peptidylprolyl isomerase, partial [Casaltella massiliensis]|nr:peptidylprolyl isomerase [Casaltella massiliensis]